MVMLGSDCSDTRVGGNGHNGHGLPALLSRSGVRALSPFFSLSHNTLMLNKRQTVSNEPVSATTGESSPFLLLSALVLFHFQFPTQPFSPGSPRGAAVALNLSAGCAMSSFVISAFMVCGFSPPCDGVVLLFLFSEKTGL